MAKILPSEQKFIDLLGENEKVSVTVVTSPDSSHNFVVIPKVHERAVEVLEEAGATPPVLFYISNAKGSDLSASIINFESETANTKRIIVARHKFWSNYGKEN